MAEESGTVRQWAACEIVADELGNWSMVAQDGSFEDAIVTEGPGVFLLSFLPGRGLDEHEGTCSSASIYDPPLFVTPVDVLLQHVNDEDKRVRVFSAGDPGYGHLNLSFNQYTACRSTATG